MIRIISSTKSGQAICPAAVIEQVLYDERSYPIVGYVVTLDDQPENVLHHDAMALLSLPDGGYRPMRPSEQNTLRIHEEAQRTVEE
jgi:hypothetical protein